LLEVRVRVEPWGVELGSPHKSFLETRFPRSTDVVIDSSFAIVEIIRTSSHLLYLDYTTSTSFSSTTCTIPFSPTFSFSHPNPLSRSPFSPRPHLPLRQEILSLQQHIHIPFLLFVSLPGSTSSTSTSQSFHECPASQKNLSIY
jgi:hypothetical protein